MNKSEKFLIGLQIDPNQRVEAPNGGIYLKNLLERFRILVRNGALQDAKGSIKDLINKQP